VRVLQVVGGLGVGGVQRSVALLAVGLHENGHQVTVVNLSVRGVNSERLEAAGVPVVHLGIWNRPWAVPATLRGLFTLWRMIWRGDWDVVQTHLFKTALVTTPVARLRGLAVVGTVHGIDPSPSQRMLSGLPARLQHAVVAVSTPLLHDVVALTTIPQRLLRVIPHGIDDPGRLLGRDDARHELGLPDGVLVGCIGSLAERKGQQDLLAVWPDVVRRCPQARLLLIGDGPLRARLTLQVAQTGTSGSVTFLGDRHDVPAVLDALDLVVVPSRHEGFSLVTVEAMRHGLPVVATAAGGPIEILRHGSTGLLVPPRDAAAMAAALTGLCLDPAQRDRLGTAALAASLDRYSVRATAEAYAVLFARLLAPGRPTRLGPLEPAGPVPAEGVPAQPVPAGAVPAGPAVIDLREPAARVIDLRDAGEPSAQPAGRDDRGEVAEHADHGGR
jgi:glycosyltransferase involved in cell wall biosynthesis